jgi:hypothetical protein
MERRPPTPREVQTKFSPTTSSSQIGHRYYSVDRSGRRYYIRNRLPEEQDLQRKNAFMTAEDNYNQHMRGKRKRRRNETGTINIDCAHKMQSDRSRATKQTAVVKKKQTRKSKEYPVTTQGVLGIFDPKATKVDGVFINASLKRKNISQRAARAVKGSLEKQRG